MGFNMDYDVQTKKIKTWPDTPSWRSCFYSKMCFVDVFCMVQADFLALVDVFNSC